MDGIGNYLKWDVRGLEILCVPDGPCPETCCNASALPYATATVDYSVMQSPYWRPSFNLSFLPPARRGILPPTSQPRRPPPQSLALELSSNQITSCGAAALAELAELPGLEAFLQGSPQCTNLLDWSFWYYVVAPNTPADGVCSTGKGAASRVFPSGRHHKTGSGLLLQHDFCLCKVLHPLPCSAAKIPLLV